MVILGAMFTFLAIAYSTTRAATQGSSIGTNQSGNIRLDAEAGDDHNLVANEPSERRRMRAEALQAAVEAGFVFVVRVNLDHSLHPHSMSLMTRMMCTQILARKMMNEGQCSINIPPSISCSSLRRVILHVCSPVGTLCSRRLRMMRHLSSLDGV